VDARGLVALGRPGVIGGWAINGWRIEPFLDRPAQQLALNRCRLAVIRAGYSTLMELSEIGKPGVLIPTPGQTEQEYVTEYQAAKGHHLAALQDSLDLADLLGRAHRATRYSP